MESEQRSETGEQPRLQPERQYPGQVTGQAFSRSHYDHNDLVNINSISLRKRLDRIDNPLAWRLAWQMYNMLVASLQAEIDADKPLQQSMTLQQLAGKPTGRFLKILAELEQFSFSWLILAGQEQLDNDIPYLALKSPGRAVNSTRDLVAHLSIYYEYHLTGGKSGNWLATRKLRLRLYGLALALFAITFTLVASVIKELLPFIPAILMVVFMCAVGILIANGNLAQQQMLALYIRLTDEFMLPPELVEQESIAWRVEHSNLEVGNLQGRTNLSTLAFWRLAKRRHKLNDPQQRRIASALLRRFSGSWQRAGLGNRRKQLESSLGQLCDRDAIWFSQHLEACRQVDWLELLAMPHPELRRRLSGPGGPYPLLVPPRRIRNPAAYARLLVDFQEALLPFGNGRLMCLQGLAYKLAGLLTFALLIYPAIAMGLAGSYMSMSSYFYTMLFYGIPLLLLLQGYGRLSLRRLLLRHLAVYIALLEQGQAAAAAAKEAAQSHNGEQQNREAGAS